MSAFLRALILSIAGLLAAIVAYAGIESKLKNMTGYTIIYGGYVRDRFEKNYGEKYLQLDNEWVFKLDCLMFLPLDMTGVIVFGKSYPDEVLKKVPKLPKHLEFQFKLLIDREICDATLVN